MHEFNPGDVVRLKSGGPAMTIDDIRGDGFVAVIWFDGAQLLRNVLLPECLVVVEMMSAP